MTVVTKCRVFELGSASSSSLKYKIISLNDTSAPFGITDELSGNGSWTHSFVRPIATEEYGDQANEFVQGPYFYRNESSVKHIHVSTTLLPTSSLSPTEGSELLGGNITLPTMWSQITRYEIGRVVRLPLPPYIQYGPDEEGAMFVRMRWSATREGLLPYRKGGAIESVVALKVNWRTGKFKQLNVAYSNRYIQAETAEQLFGMLDNSTISVSEPDAWKKNPDYPITRSRSYSRSEIEEALASERVVQAQLHSLCAGARSWKQESAHLTDARYLARAKVVTSIADQVGRMTSNNAALVIELAKLLRSLVDALRGNPQALTRLLDEVRHVRNAKDASKVLANLRLSEQYGLRLTVRDTLDLANWLNNLEFSSESIARTSVNYSWFTNLGLVHTSESWKVFYSANPADMPVTTRLLIEDTVGLANVWDLIPYSFVVDWFFPVGDNLQGIDDEWMLSSLPIHAIVVGEKTVFSKVTCENGIQRITLGSSYTRGRAYSFPPYATATSHSVNTTTVLNGAALIVQRL